MLRAKRMFFDYNSLICFVLFLIILFRDPQRGVTPRAMSQIFDYISHYKNRHAKFLVRVRMLQIYQEELSDLMKPENNNLVIRERPNGQTFVEVMILITMIQ